MRCQERSLGLFYGKIAVVVFASVAGAVLFSTERAIPPAEALKDPNIRELLINALAKDGHSLKDGTSADLVRICFGLAADKNRGANVEALLANVTAGPIRRLSNQYGEPGCADSALYYSGIRDHGAFLPFQHSSSSTLTACGFPDPLRPSLLRFIASRSHFA